MQKKHPALIAAFMGLATLSFSALAEGLSAQEKDITQWIAGNADEALGSLETLLAINSPTENHDGQREMGEFFASRFKHIGFATQWIDMRESTDRGGHFQAELQGSKGKRLLLIGHLDTVLPAIDVRREGNKLFGSGAEDMKGGDLVILNALEALYHAGALDGRRIIVHFTGDEESAGSPITLARTPLKNAARRSDAVLSFEGSNDHEAVVARRSSGNWQMVVASTTGHSSQIFSEKSGYGAIYEASRIINAFREELAGEEYLTFNVSLIAGGVTAEMQKSDASAWGKGNIIPAIVHAQGDLRVLSIEQRDRTQSRMRKIVNTHNLPHTTASIEFENRYPPMSPTPENYALLALLDQASEDLGYGPVEAVDPSARGAGDISFIAPMLPGLDGLGVVGANGHAKDEYMEIDSLVRQTQRAALLIYRLTR